MKRITAINFFVLIAIFLSIGTIAQENWDLKKDKDGIKVYSRKNELSKFNQVRVICSVDAKLSELAALILDVTNYSNWVYCTKKTSILKKVNDSELYYYAEINSPWPVSNRDLAVDLKISQDTITKAMTILAECMPNYIPVNENIVRVPVSKAVWKVTPSGGGRLDIDYQLQVDIGGSVPSWIFNMFIARGPYESFKKLKEVIHLDKYTATRLSFINN